MAKTPSKNERRDDRCVLVVEDDAPLRNLLVATLRLEGLTVSTARNGAEAIQRLSKQRFRVVLLDLMMPLVNGWEVIDWLRDHPANVPRSVMVVTAADRNVFAELDPTVVNAIIVKPFDTYELAGYVRRCCDTEIERDRRHKRVIGQV